MLEKVYAAAANTTAVNPLESTFGTNVTITAIFGLITNVVLGIGVALTAVFLVMGGIQYVTARGDAKAAEQARASLTNAVIGFVVILAAYTIKYLV